jgi:aspergillopepsin I
MTVDLDTGSADLWVFSTSVSERARGDHKLYDPKKSKQSKILTGGRWVITYGDGSGATGSVVTDTVNVGSIQVKNQAVELAERVSGTFIMDKTDGLLGLAFQKINQIKPDPQKTFFENALPQLSNPVFTVHLKQGAAGSFDFGYIDKAKYIAPLHYEKIDPSNGFWEFDSSSATVNGRTITVPEGRAIIDTGTTLLLAADNIVEAYYKEVELAEENYEAGGWVFPCDAKLPKFSIAVGKYQAQIPGEHIKFAPVGEMVSMLTGKTKQVCMGALQTAPMIPAGDNRYIYGDIILKSHFVVFDYGADDKSPRMAIAPQADSDAK